MVFARPLLCRGLLLLTGLSAVAAVPAAACGSESGASPESEDVISGAANGATEDSALVAGPVSQFSVLVEEVDLKNLITHADKTWELTAAIYAKTTAFADEDEGSATLTRWGYAEGYETAMSPEGGNDAILNGGYAILQELHLFHDTAGAIAAFDYFREKVSTNGISRELADVGVGDESFASQTVSGKVGAGSANVDRVLHQVILRRGNVVAVVMTVGAAPLMSVEPAEALAAIVDEKLRDVRLHPAPTPIPGRTPTGERTAAP